MLDLPEQAISELRDIIKKEVGNDSYKKLSDYEIHNIAEFLLETMATALKIRTR